MTENDDPQSRVYFSLRLLANGEFIYWQITDARSWFDEILGFSFWHFNVIKLGLGAELQVHKPRDDAGKQEQPCHIWSWLN